MKFSKMKFSKGLTLFILPVLVYGFSEKGITKVKKASNPLESQNTLIETAPQSLGNTPSTPFVKPSADELKKRLTPEQYSCTQEAGTEKPFQNKYWNHKEDGIYVDLISGEPLFSSLDKYDSGSGWPSFTKPLDQDSLIFKKDFLIGYERTEVKTKSADSHLGHVFSDGPKEAGGKRYCMNSASLDFVPLEQLNKKGLGKYLFLFAAKKKWEVAILAGGCFWGVEELFREKKGVIETQTGYTGGKSGHPLYTQVKTGTTGHAEAVRILFDPQSISYEDLLIYFFKLHDPTTPNRQGNDVGTQYRSSIFFADDQQKATAEKVKARVEKSGAWKKPVVTEIIKAETFWPAEDYHQKYLQKNPAGYTCHFLRPLQF